MKNIYKITFLLVCFPQIGICQTEPTQKIIELMNQDATQCGMVPVEGCEEQFAQKIIQLVIDNKKQELQNSCTQTDTKTNEPRVVTSTDGQLFFKALQENLQQGFRPQGNIVTSPEADPQNNRLTTRYTIFLTR